MRRAVPNDRGSAPVLARRPRPARRRGARAPRPLRTERHRRDVRAGVEGPLARDRARSDALVPGRDRRVLYALLGERAEAPTLLGAIVPLVGDGRLSCTGARRRRRRACASRLAARAARRARRRARSRFRSTDVRARRPRPASAPASPFPADGVVVARRRPAGRRVGAHRRGLSRAQADPLADRTPGARAASARDRRRALGLRRARACSPAARRCASLLTGGETLYGEIVRSAGPARATRTPLQTAIGGPGRASWSSPRRCCVCCSRRCACARATAGSTRS